MKILTLAAAAQTLGWDHRFTTSLETSAPIENGVLRGDLFIRGNGDPTINTRENRARSRVRRVGAGTARGRHHRRSKDASSATTRRSMTRGSGPGWSWDYLEAGYAAPIGALQYNENTAELTVAPGAAAGDPAIVDARARQRAFTV